MMFEEMLQQELFRALEWRVSIACEAILCDSESYRMEAHERLVEARVLIDEARYKNPRLIGRLLTEEKNRR